MFIYMFNMFYILYIRSFLLMIILIIFNLSSSKIERRLENNSLRNRAYLKGDKCVLLGAKGLKNQCRFRRTKVVTQLLTTLLLFGLGDLNLMTLYSSEAFEEEFLLRAAVNDSVEPHLRLHKQLLRPLRENVTPLQLSLKALCKRRLLHHSE